MRAVRLIGITGAARSGKDTVASMISREIGGVRYSMAAPMYGMLAAAGLDFKSPEWADLKEKPIDGIGKSPRQMLQTLGTEWGRDLINEDLWIIFAKIQLDNCARAIIPDIRFENEAAWVRENGVLIRVVRPDVELVNPHVSEAGVIPHSEDFTLNNSGTLAQLQHAVSHMTRAIFE